MIRERLSSDLKQAIKAKEAARVSTLRLILAAIKDRDIAAVSYTHLTLPTTERV